MATKDDELKAECERLSAKLWPDSDRIDVYMGGRSVVDAISDGHSHHMVSIFDQDKNRSGLAMLAALRALAGEPDPVRAQLDGLAEHFDNEAESLRQAANTSERRSSLALAYEDRQRAKVWDKAAAHVRGIVKPKEGL